MSDISPKLYCPAMGSTHAVTVRDGHGTFHYLSPNASLRLVNHSPTGFSWGYMGSGPSQLALAILLDFTGNEELSLKYYQRFKEDFVCKWGEHWKINGDEIAKWLEDRKIENTKPEDFSTWTPGDPGDGEAENG